MILARSQSIVKENSLDNDNWMLLPKLNENNSLDINKIYFLIIHIKWVSNQGSKIGKKFRLNFGRLFKKKFD